MSLDSALVRSSLPEFKTFPKSVVGLDCNIVKEIHFDKNRLFKSEKDKDSFQVLCNMYELHHSNVLDNLFSHGGPDIKWLNEEMETQCEPEVEAGGMSEAEDRGVCVIEAVVETENKTNVSTSQVPVLSCHEKQNLVLLSSECESLKKQLFEKQQQLKIANDKINQLQEKNTCRREVVRLETVLEENEKEKAILIENVEKQNEQLRFHD